MFAWVHSGAPKYHRVHPGSRGLTRARYLSSVSGGARVVVIGFIRVGVGASSFFEFARVHSDAPKILFWFAWIHSGAPRGLPVHSGSRRFTRAQLGVVGFIDVRVSPGAPLIILRSHVMGRCKRPSLGMIVHPITSGARGPTAAPYHLIT